MSRGVNNYFKVVIPRSETHFFTFNDNSFEEVQDTYHRARLLAGKVGGTLSIYNPTFYPGEWDHSEIVGHRNIEAILVDLRQAQKDFDAAAVNADAEVAQEDISLAIEELEARKARFSHREDAVS